jgi:L-seryl-tRNA(Ser) seleniumtransferase
MANMLGNFPSINELLDSPPLKSLVERVNPARVMNGVRSFVEGMRQEVQTAVKERQIPSPVALAEQIAQWIMRQEQTGVRSVINATGTVLHPELGGPPLAEEALLALRNSAGSFTRCGVGSNSAPQARIEQLLRELTGCEAALVVNNAAAALGLVVCTLSTGRRVLVPQGQMGSSWHGARSFDWIEPAGGNLRSIGAVNETSIDDFNRAAADGQAGLILWQEGLTYHVPSSDEQVTLPQLGGWARSRSLPLAVELGHGGIIDGASYGLTPQPTLSAAWQAGAAIIICHGEALLGGPPCGIIAGRASYLRQLAANPLFATVASDKLTLSSLEATLELYQAAAGQPSASLERSLPLWELLSASAENLKHRCERLAPQLAASPALAAVETLSGTASLTGAKLASQQLPTSGLALKPAQGTAADLLAALANGSPAVVGRLENDRVWLDLRAMSPKEDQQVVMALEQLNNKGGAVAQSAESPS